MKQNPVNTFEVVDKLQQVCCHLLPYMVVAPLVAPELVQATPPIVEPEIPNLLQPPSSRPDQEILQLILVMKLAPIHQIE